MPRARRAALLGGGVSVYADLNFAAARYKVGTSSAGDLTALPGFTFTRASLAMGYDATGKLTYGPNNLLTYSQLFSDAAWTKSNSTVAQVSGAEWTLTEAVTTSRKMLLQNTGVSQLGKLFSIEAKPNGRNFVAIGITSGGGLYSVYSFNVSTGALVGGYTAGAEPVPTNPVITSLGDGWYRVSVVLTSAQSQVVVMISNGGDPIFEGYTGNGTSGLLIRKPQLEAVTYQTTPSTYYPTTTAAYYGPRLVYDPVTLASQGILVEEARTNVCLQSSSFATTWSATNVTITSDATTAPDGANTADKIEATATAVSSFNQIAAGGGATSGSTGSVFAKQGSGATDCNRFTLRDNTAGTNLLQFTVNYSTGAITYSTGSSGATVTNVGNGWWRIAATAAAASNGNNIRLYVGFDGGAETAGEFAYFWGAQIEAGTGASSPIPTTTASVTRAADNVRLTGLTLSYPTTLAAGFIRNFGAAAGRGASFYVDGNNFTAIGLSSASAARLDVATGGVFQAQITGATITNGTAVLEAARVATNDGAFAVNGTLAGTDTAITTPAAPTAVNIGMLSDNGSDSINGTISRIRIYNSALPDAQLQSLTS